jgi:hypothetical protein
LLAVEARMHAGDEIDGVLHLQPARQDGDVGDEADVLHQVVALGARVDAQHRQLAVEGDQAQRGLEVVVLPEPLGPIRPTMRPAGISKLMPSTAARLP